MRAIAIASAILVLVLIGAAAAIGQQQAALPQGAQQETAPPSAAQPPAGEVTPDRWPQTAEVGGATYTIYQPQLDSWNGYTAALHAAVSVLPAGAKEATFGMIDITAHTMVDRNARTVTFSDAAVPSAKFPSAPDKAAQYEQTFKTLLATGPAVVPLDRLQTALSILGEQQKAQTVAVQNNPPALIFSDKPAVLVTIDGDPEWVKVPGSSLERVVNTPALILRDASGALYMHVFDGFLQAASLKGPWVLATSVPSDATAVAERLGQQHVVDLMTGPKNQTTGKQPSLSEGVPDVIVVTQPTELIVTNGAPQWTPIEGTQLLYISNTTGNVFKDLSDQQTYVLVTGRWFRAPGLSGPWQYVAGADLPADFRSIPDDSAKENVKASIPGTPQAQEAVIATQIPQTATVNRGTTTFTPDITGAPVMRPISGTDLSYVENSAAPIIKVSDTSWYAVQNGVWFTASSLEGPWTVATSVPAAIYSIPPSSPLYYVTYVKVYDVTPDSVVTGYTPGYMGAVTNPEGVVVYGTGYTYPPYIAQGVWYPAPVTYGYAANMTWTPWTSWAFGFGLGWAVAEANEAWDYNFWGPAPYWGAMPYAGYARGPYGGAAVWGANGWAATSGNVYHRWGPTSVTSRASTGFNAWTGNAWSSQVARSYNSVTGRVSAGQRAGVQNVYTGNYASAGRAATHNPRTGATTGVARVGNDYYADRNGNVYRSTGTGWQRYSRSGWNDVRSPAETQSLQSQQAARQFGNSRTAGASWGGNWGGDFRAGGGRGFGGGSFASARGGFDGFHGGRR